MSLDQRAEELASDLGVDNEEVKHDLSNLVSYSVPIDEAIQSIRRKYGTDGDASRSISADRTIDAISVDDNRISVTACVLTMGRRSIRYQGATHVITEGVLGDGSGTIDYTAWDGFDFDPGDTITIENATIREWDGSPELNLGDQTVISRADSPLTIDEPVGGARTLDTVDPGDRGITLDVRVIETEHRVIDGRDGETDIISGVFGDSTGRLPFTDWAPRPAVTPGASLHLENVYVREFRGVPSINLSEFTTAEPVEPSIEVPDRAPRTPIATAIDAGGRYDIEFVATVVAVREGSGLIQRCPDCNRVIQRGECRQHGSVDGIDDLRVKAILDDGTGTVTAVLGTDLSAVIYGDDLDGALDHARAAVDQGVVTEAIRTAIIGRTYRARGALRVDDFGATLDVSAFDPVEASPAELAARLYDGVSP